MGVLSRGGQDSPMTWTLGSKFYNAALIDGQVEVLHGTLGMMMRPPSNATAAHVAAYSSEEMDLRDGSASATVGPTTGGAMTVFMVIAGSDTWYAFAVTKGTLAFVAREHGQSLGSKAPLDLSEHRQWRFRHDLATNTLYWETRSAEGEWRVRHSAHPQTPLSAVFLEVAAGTSSGVDDPGVATFEDISVRLKH
jgi:hypothetical protein